MSQNRIDLMTAAAELRAAGHSWESVARKLNRQPATCQKWVNRYPQEWSRIYLEAQKNRYEEVSNESLSFLRGLLRSEIEKTQLKSIELVMKYGPDAIAAIGAALHPPAEETKAKEKEKKRDDGRPNLTEEQWKTADLWEGINKVWSEANQNRRMHDRPQLSLEDVVLRLEREAQNIHQERSGKCGPPPSWLEDELHKARLAAEREAHEAAQPYRGNREPPANAYGGVVLGALLVLAGALMMGLFERIPGSPQRKQGTETTSLLARRALETPLLHGAAPDVSLAVHATPSLRVGLGGLDVDTPVEAIRYNEDCVPSTKSGFPILVASPGSTRLTLPMWHERHAAPPAPMTAEEMRARGWEDVDVVFVTGDAYVDHPSFAMAILQRVLEAEGFRVAMLSQPDWHSCEPWRQFGRPRLFYGISAGNMDSLINHYTANKKVRNDDAYSPGGKIGLRPDRATLSYCQRAREAFPGVPIIAGGVEASLRRLAHYDYWSDTVRRSILLDAKADLLVYGMGEENIVEIARRLAAGKTVRDLRDLRGVAYALGARESDVLMDSRGSQGSQSLTLGYNPSPLRGLGLAPEGRQTVAQGEALRTLGFEAQIVQLPTYEEVRSEKRAFIEATRLIHINTNPFNAAALVQFHDRQAVVANPPPLPLSPTEMDRIYDLPYTRRPHPSYREPIPAYEMIKDSITTMRGCFGGCTFCSITAHQGRIIQSRSPDSIVREAQKLAEDPEFKGVISDVGGPTANMYQMRCTRPEVEAKCKRLSCVHPTICKLLGTDHQPTIDLLKQVRETPGIRRVFVSSGIRMDLAQLSPEYVDDLARNHVGGRLKVAPEHTSPTVLGLMKKPSIDNFGSFAKQFEKASKKAGKPKQYLVPYFIASHPGSGIAEMIDLALYLKRNGYRPDQVQDFIPAPFDIATCMWYTGIDPMSGKEVTIARHMRDRKLQRALMQFFKPENWFEVREALLDNGRGDLIGSGCDCLIPAQPPKEAIEARRKNANSALRNDYYHSMGNPGHGEEAGERTQPPLVKNRGYRPHRKTQQRKRK